MRKINRIIIHCTATKEGADYDVSDIRRWHLANGWTDVGYHYVIKLDGDIQEGRPKVTNVKGHRDYSPDKNHDGKITQADWIKACPSFEVSEWMKETGLDKLKV